MSDQAILADSPFAAKEYEKLPPRVWWAGALMVTLGVATFILMSEPHHVEGYLYLFLYSIPSNTAISAFPHEPVLIYYGKFANIWLSALAATGGTAVAGYLDHRVFVPVLNYTKLTSYKKGRFYGKATRMFMRYPFATLVATGFTPIPFWPFKFLCFSIHYPLWRYLAALVLARFPRYVLLLWVGSRFAIPNWILLGTVAAIFAVYAVRGIPAAVSHVRRRRQDGLKAAAKQDDPAREVG